MDKEKIKLEFKAPVTEFFFFFFKQYTWWYGITSASGIDAKKKKCCILYNAIGIVLETHAIT